ncbi:MAG TPA: type II toxin-antitoxin system PemK/MazF family toxin, partial [Jatrophihabitantaceae bacterium]|nr:type II toxin-antitoxin system PemK/MazF family toxin [Jatrophihabitantaceae bacterium]
LQPEDFMVSTLIIAPTSTSAGDAAFRPVVRIAGKRTRVMVEQMTAVDPTRLGDYVGHLSRTEHEDVRDAVRVVLGLD